MLGKLSITPISSSSLSKCPHSSLCGSFFYFTVSAVLAVDDDEPLVFVEVLLVCDGIRVDVLVHSWDVCVDFLVVLDTVLVDLFDG